MVRAQLDFNKYIGSTNHHNISASVGFEMNSTQYDANLSVERGYYKDLSLIHILSSGFRDSPLGVVLREPRNRLLLCLLSATIILRAEKRASSAALLYVC